METKDVLTLIGILLVLAVGLINIGITLKNRRNVIREHLFKEQITFHYKLFVQITILNNEADSLLNDDSKRHNNDFESRIDVIRSLMHENIFILENDSISLINSLLEEAFKFYMKFLTTDRAKTENGYKAYYQSYFEFLKLTRSSFGIDLLSLENKNLYTKNKINDFGIGKMVAETLEITAKSILKF